MRKLKFIRLYIPIYLVLLLISLSCTKKDAHEFTTSINDDGVEICVNSGGPKYSEPLYDIEETLSLGGEDPVPKLFQPRDLLVDEDGFLYFSNDDRIKKFDSKGNFLSFIGNQGEGPGEVNYPWVRRIVGDTIVVDQYRKMGGPYRYDLFSRDGSFIDRILIPSIKEKLLEVGWNYIQQYLGTNYVVFSTSNSWDQGDAQFTHYAYGLANTKGEFIKKFDIELEPKNSGIYQKGEGYVVTMSKPFTIGCKIEAGQYIYFLLPSGKEIKVFTREGILEKIIQLDLPEQPVTQEDRDRIMNRQNRPNSRLLIKNHHFPSVKPVACEIIADNRGWLWLKKGEYQDEYGKNPSTYMLLDEKGKYIADQTLPINLSAVKNNHVYGFIMTEDDLKIFKRYRLKRRF